MRLVLFKFFNFIVHQLVSLTVFSRLYPRLRTRRVKMMILTLALMAILGSLPRSTADRESLEVVPSGSQSHLVDDSSLPWASGVAPIGPSYAGMTEVRRTADNRASLFYWFFPCQKVPDAPLVIWLQGGPLASSMIGVFYESGPLRVTRVSAPISSRKETIKDFILSTNPHSWHNRFNMVFLDQPAGTGYSFVDPPLPPTPSQSSDGSPSQAVLAKRAEATSPTIPAGHESNTDDYNKGYVTNESGVAKDFLAFLKQFYIRFPSMARVNLTIASESYGGKYVPSIATAITAFNSQNPTATIPLKSLTIGNQWTDPYSQMATTPSQLLYFGCISPEQSTIAQKMVVESQALIKQERWQDALDHRMKMMDMLTNFTGDVDWYDVRLKNQPSDQIPMNHFLRCEETKKILHVPADKTFRRDAGSMEIFLGDIMRSTKDLFPKLLSQYKILLYQGNMDLRDGVMSNTAWLSELKWSGSEAFNQSPRKIWKSSKGELYGYVNQSGNLTRVVLLGCGHRVPADDGCPEASFEMMTRHLHQDTFM